MRRSGWSSPSSSRRDTHGPKLRVRNSVAVTEDSRRITARVARRGSLVVVAVIAGASRALLRHRYVERSPFR